MAFPPPHTEGQRLLQAVPHSGQKMGRDLGISPMSVSRYLHGSGMPGDGTRGKMLALWGIPKDSWDRHPGSSPAPVPVTTPEPPKPAPPKPAPPAASKVEDPRDSFAAKPKPKTRPKPKKPKAPKKPKSAPAKPVDLASVPEPVTQAPSEMAIETVGEVEVPGASSDPIAEFDRQIQMLQRAQAHPSLTPVAFAKYSDQIGRLLAQKASVSVKLETVETRFWKSPGAKKLANALLGLAERYPQIEEELLEIFESGGR